MSPDTFRIAVVIVDVIITTILAIVIVTHWGDWRELLTVLRSKWNQKKARTK